MIPALTITIGIFFSHTTETVPNTITNVYIFSYSSTRSKWLLKCVSSIWNVRDSTILPFSMVFHTPSFDSPITYHASFHPLTSLSPFRFRSYRDTAELFAFSVFLKHGHRMIEICHDDTFFTITNGLYFTYCVILIFVQKFTFSV